MPKFNRKKVMNLLTKHKSVDVEFTKVDGTVRQMKATRHPEVLAEKVGDKPPNKSYKSEIDAMHNNVTVFDLEKNGFRSFNVDRLKRMKIK